MIVCRPSHLYDALGSIVTSHSGELALGSLRAFETWEPLLRTVREQNPDVARWAGAIGRGGAVVPRPDGASDSDRAELEAAVLHLEGTLARARMRTVSFSVQYEADGRVEVRLAPASAPQVFDVPGSNTTGHLVLVEHALPEPRRKRPEVFPGLTTASSADPVLLERTLRERLPDAVGVTDAEIVATENELGVELPDELKAVYRVTNAEHGGDWERFARESEILGFALLPLEELYFAEGAIERHSSFEDAATVAAVTRPTDAVQGVVASPGWIVIGDLSDGAGVPLCVDLTPGPAGHVGQLIALEPSWSVGAWLRAESITRLMLDGPVEDDDGRCPGELPPAVVMVNSADGWDIHDAATVELEVLKIGWWDADPTDLAPLVGLPRLRTLTAMPGKIADPLVIGGLPGLEYLQIGLDEWQALIDADDVPRSLLAAGISGYNNPPDRVRAVFDALRSQWGFEPYDEGRRTITGRLDR